MKISTDSPVWRVIEAHLTLRLATCREKNDSDKLDAFATAKLRGEIAALKDLLDLPAQLAAPLIDDDPGYSVHSLDD